MVRRCFISRKWSEEKAPLISEDLIEGNDIAYIGAKHDENGLMMMCQKEGFEDWISNIEHTLNSGGTMLSLQFGNRTIGIITVNGSRTDNLYVEGRFQRNGFGTQLLQYAISFAGKGAYIDVPKTNKVLTHICEGLKNLENTEDHDAVIRFIF